MTYPGNEGQSGGWPAEQPPQRPYAPGSGSSGPSGHGQSPYGQSPHAHSEYGQSQYGDSPYGQDEPGGHQPSGGHRGPTPPGRRGSLPLIAGAAVVVGIVLIGGGIEISGALRPDAASKPASPATPRQTASAPAAAASPTVSTSPSTRPGALGNSRTTDPTPLTLNEIFRRHRFTVSGKRYAMTVGRSDRNCARTVKGARLVTALKRGSCTQVVRATFAAGDGKLIGTVGVANLRTAVAAKAAARTWNAKDAWVQPVPGPGITKKIGTGSALGTLRYKGHYLLMTWVQQPNGKEIPAGERAAISKFGQDVMFGSGLFAALNYRSNEGKPVQK
ncbi:MAG: hypothetical protein JWO67_495 [Streptosporangiaceae bacterium]|nr:hypothetical protein [Streptosporangiaceae bacterium]